MIEQGIYSRAAQDHVNANGQSIPMGYGRMAVTDGFRAVSAALDGDVREYRNHMTDAFGRFPPLFSMYSTETSSGEKVQVLQMNNKVTLPGRDFHIAHQYAAVGDGSVYAMTDQPLQWMQLWYLYAPMEPVARRLASTDRLVPEVNFAVGTLTDVLRYFSMTPEAFEVLLASLFDSIGEGKPEKAGVLVLVDDTRQDYYDWIRRLIVHIYMFLPFSMRRRIGFDTWFMGRDLSGKIRLSFYGKSALVQQGKRWCVRLAKDGTAQYDLREMTVFLGTGLLMPETVSEPDFRKTNSYREFVHPWIAGALDPQNGLRTEGVLNGYWKLLEETPDRDALTLNAFYFLSEYRRVFENGAFPGVDGIEVWAAEFSHHMGEKGNALFCEKFDRLAAQYASDDKKKLMDAMLGMLEAKVFGEGEWAEKAYGKLVAFYRQNMQGVRLGPKQALKVLKIIDEGRLALDDEPMLSLLDNLVRESDPWENLESFIDMMRLGNIDRTVKEKLSVLVLAEIPESFDTDAHADMLLSKLTGIEPRAYREEAMACFIEGARPSADWPAEKLEKTKKYADGPRLKKAWMECFCRAAASGRYTAAVAGSLIQSASGELSSLDGSVLAMEVIAHTDLSGASSNDVRAFAKEIGGYAPLCRARADMDKRLFEVVMAARLPLAERIIIVIDVMENAGPLLAGYTLQQDELRIGEANDEAQWGELLRMIAQTADGVQAELSRTPLDKNIVTFSLPVVREIFQLADEGGRVFTDEWYRAILENMLVTRDTMKDAIRLVTRYDAADTEWMTRQLDRVVDAIPVSPDTVLDWHKQIKNNAGALVQTRLVRRVSLTADDDPAVAEEMFLTLLEYAEGQDEELARAAREAYGRLIGTVELPDAGPFIDFFNTIGGTPMAGADELLAAALTSSRSLPDWKTVEREYTFLGTENWKQSRHVLREAFLGTLTGRSLKEIHAAMAGISDKATKERAKAIVYQAVQQEIENTRGAGMPSGGLCRFFGVPEGTEKLNGIAVSQDIQLLQQDFGKTTDSAIAYLACLEYADFANRDDALDWVDQIRPASETNADYLKQLDSLLEKKVGDGFFTGVLADKYKNWIKKLWSLGLRGGSRGLYACLLAGYKRGYSYFSDMDWLYEICNAQTTVAGLHAVALKLLAKCCEESLSRSCVSDLTEFFRRLGTKLERPEDCQAVRGRACVALAARQNNLRVVINDLNRAFKAIPDDCGRFDAADTYIRATRDLSDEAAASLNREIGKYVRTCYYDTLKNTTAAERLIRDLLSTGSDRQKRERTEVFGVVFSEQEVSAAAESHWPTADQVYDEGLESLMRGLTAETPEVRQEYIRWRLTLAWQQLFRLARQQNERIVMFKALGVKRKEELLKGIWAWSDSCFTAFPDLPDILMPGICREYVLGVENDKIHFVPEYPEENGRAWQHMYECRYGSYELILFLLQKSRVDKEETRNIWNEIRQMYAPPELKKMHDYINKVNSLSPTGR